MQKSVYYQRLYIASLTPFEKLEFSKRNKCKFSLEPSSFYLSYWKENICKTASEESFLKYLNLNHLSEEDIRKVTSDILEVESKIRYPKWISVLKDISRKLNLERLDFDTKNQQPFYHLLQPFLSYFADSFRDLFKKENADLIHDGIVDQLVQVLFEDLLKLSELVLLKEFKTFKKNLSKAPVTKIHDVDSSLDDALLYKKFVTTQIDEKFQTIFLKYPMLARKLTTKTYRYASFAIELFKRLSKDKAEIAYCFKQKLQRLTTVSLNAGDQHNGETTVILEFENAQKIVYKPGDAAVTDAYNNVLRWVNYNLDETLKTFEAINKGCYSWLQFVSFEACNKEQDIQLFYKRAGILVGITYFLNSRDYHYENIIAAGNCPVIIDHETIVGPNTSDNYFVSQNGESLETIVGTVLESLLLPIEIKEFPPYAGGLGSSRFLQTNAYETKIIYPNKDNMKRVVRLVLTKLFKQNKPHLNDKVKNLINYQKEFKDGFTILYQLIQEKKDFLLSKSSPLVAFKSLKIRYICRNTFLYFKILKYLNNPEYLGDAMRYGIKLELISRAFLDNKSIRGLLDSERAQMLMGDIPAFYTNTLTKELVLHNGKRIEFFKLNSMDSIKEKILKASSRDYDHQVKLLNQVIEY